MGSRGRDREQYDSRRDQEADYSNYDYEQTPYPAPSGHRSHDNDYHSEPNDNAHSNYDDKQLQRRGGDVRGQKRSRHDDYSDSSTDSSDSEDDRRAHRSSRNKHSSRNNPTDPEERVRQAVEKGKEHLSVSGKGAAATLIGAIAGGMLGLEATKKEGKKRGGSDKEIGGALVGAIAGGLGGNVLGKKFDE